MSVTKNPQAPHRSVLWLQAEVYELLPTGECSGMPAKKIERFPLYLDGHNQAEATTRLEELLDEVKRRCPIK